MLWRDPRDIEIDSLGNVYVSSRLTSNILKMMPNGTIKSVLNTQGDNLGNPLDQPIEIALDSADNLYVTSNLNHRVFKISPNETVTQLFNGSGTEFVSPEKIAIDSQNNILVSVGGDSVIRISPDNSFVEIMDELGAINSIVTDSVGNAFIAAGNSVYKIAQDNVRTTIINSSGDGRGNSLIQASSLAVDSADNVLVSGTLSSNVFRIAPDGQISRILGNSGDDLSNRSKLQSPGVIAVDSAGVIYIADDSTPFRILRLEPLDDITQASFPTFTQFAGSVATTDEDTATAIEFSTLLAQGNEADSDGTVTQFKIVSVSNGMLSIDGQPFNSITNSRLFATTTAEWIPPTNQNGMIPSFTTQVVDNDGKRNFDVVGAQIQVNPINDSPTVTVNRNIVVNEGGAQRMELSIFDVADVDDDLSGLTFTISTLPQHGNLTLGLPSSPLSAGSALQGDSLFTPLSVVPTADRLLYEHDGSETISDSFEFTLTDGGENGASTVTGTINISITPVDDPVMVQNLAGDRLDYVLGMPDTVLDQNRDAQVTDADNLSLNGLLLIVSSTRVSADDPNGANDIFSFSGTGISSTTNNPGTPVIIDSETIGTVEQLVPANSAAKLVIRFNANATLSRVSQLLQNLSFQSANTDVINAGERQVTIDIFGSLSGLPQQSITLLVQASTPPAVVAPPPAQPPAPAPTPTPTPYSCSCSCTCSYSYSCSCSCSCSCTCSGPCSGYATSGTV